MIELLNMDCMDYMKQCTDNQFDLAIVDPPYGIGHSLLSGENRGSKFVRTERHVDWDIMPPKEYFQELFRISQNQIIWGGNYFIEYLKNTRCVVIWDKIQEFSGADFEVAWTSFDSSSKAFRMSRVEAYSNGKIHPTQKPVQLYKWLLDNYATCKTCKNEGGYYEDVAGDGGSRMWIGCDECDGSPIKIIDTHLGSGSIAIACHDYKFDLVGLEIDKEYYDKASQRLKDHQKQLVLF